MRVIQILTTISFGDAVSNDCLAIRDLLKKEGYNTSIYAENISPKAEGLDVRPYGKLPKIKPDDVVIYHLSTGTELNKRIKDINCRKFIVYHNTTPPEFFVPYSGKLARLCNNGLEETIALKDTFDGGFCDSDFNRQQLISYGYKCRLEVRPILIPFDDYKKTPDADVLAKMGGNPYETPHETKNVLFVGRIAPNKSQEDLIAMICAYKKLYKEPVRLILVGNPGGMEKYQSRLRAYTEALGLKEGEDVIFTGQQSFPAILAYYRSADCFVSMSEHEGFCVPLVEAFSFDIPVLAYESTAVPETLGGSGILLKTKDPAVAAANLHEILYNDTIRAKIVEEQRKRLDDFSYENVSRLFLKQFKEFIG